MEDNYHMMEVDILNPGKDMVLFADNHNPRIVHEEVAKAPAVKQRVHEGGNSAGCIHQREVMALWSKQRKRIRIKVWNNQS